MTVNLFGQKDKPILSFKRNAYPASKFIINSDTSLFGQVQIIITMTHPKSSSDAKYFCHSWLTTKKNNKVLTQKYYDIEPVGGCSGLYVPSTQPCGEYFIISKFGDYDGQTLIIDTTGKLTTLKGGSFSVSKDKKYLFATFDSDVPGLTIYDLKNRQLIFSKESDGEVEYRGFYCQDSSYFVSIYNDDTSKEISVGTIDFQNKKIKLTKKNRSFLKKMNKLKDYNSIQSLSKCDCGE